MKKFAVVCSALYAFSMSAELWAQTRGPRYNPPSSSSSGSSSSSSRPSSSSSSSSSSSRPSSSSSSSSSPSRSSGSSTGSSSSGSTSRGSNYNPPSSSGSSTTGSSSSGSTRRGSNYNPPSSSGSTTGSSSSGSSSRGSNYNPPSSSGSTTGSSSSRSTGRGSNYNPPSSSGSSSSTTPQGPRYNPPGSSSSGSTYAPRGPRYNPPRTDHTPVRVSTTVIRFGGPRDYYNHINRHYIYRRWVQYPVQYWYTDGYWDIDGYPYYVNRGYRYRYNPVEMCQYELVDAETYATVKVYPVQACTTAYDQCAVERDSMNRTISLERYFCAEAVDDDLVQTSDADYQASAIEMTEVKKAAIRSYLTDMTYKDLFRDGGVGNCSIVKVGGVFGNRSPYNCKYQVNVGDKAYPAVNGSVCSDDSAAATVQCNVGNEKENTGCILNQAIEQGYCH